jgi:prevent-host-death family protein
MAKAAIITMLDLRRRAIEIVRSVERGRRLIVTYRGRPVMRLEPIASSQSREDDAFYRLGEMGAAKGATLSNKEIDDLVYGP